MLINVLIIHLCYYKKAIAMLAPVVWGFRIQPTFALVRVVRDD